MIATLKKLGMPTLSLVLMVALVGYMAFPQTAAAYTLEQTTTGTATGDVTINVPTGLSNVTVVYCSAINDGDGAHTGIDGTFTFGGLTMTSAFTQQNDGNYHASCYYLTSYTGTGNQTMHYGNHGGFGTIQWAVWIISGSNATQPDVSAATGNTASANPSQTLTTTATNELDFEVVGSSNSLTAASSQTVDQSSDTNLAVAHKTLTASGSNTLSWTSGSGSWVQGDIVIKSSGVTPPPATSDSSYIVLFN